MHSRHGVKRLEFFVGRLNAENHGIDDFLSTAGGSGDSPTEHGGREVSQSFHGGERLDFGRKRRWNGAVSQISLSEEFVKGGGRI